jgi:L-galactose dehydrogenase
LQASGVAVINASPLGMGLLTPGGPPAWHPAPPGLLAACKSAVETCRTQGSDVSQVAIAQALREPGVVSTLVGMCTVDEVRRNVGIATAALQEGAAAADAAAVAALLPTWQAAGPVTWPSGLPENNA